MHDGVCLDNDTQWPFSMHSGGRGAYENLVGNVKTK